MSRLVLDLPDQHIQVLERVAHDRGTSIDEIVAELVDTIATHESLDANYDVTRDPVYLIKAHDSSAPADLSRNADHYLYGAAQQ